MSVGDGRVGGGGAEHTAQAVKSGTDHDSDSSSQR